MSERDNMDDDIMIGTGNHGCSAIKMTKYEFLSQNSVSYWFWDSDLIDVKAFIMKDTRQAATMKEMMDKDCSVEELYNYCLDLAMNKLPVQYIIDQIKEVKERAFHDGMRAKALEIRCVLGVN
jgi:hypothetical protein